MSSPQQIITLFIMLVIVFPTHLTFAQEQKKEKPWTGTLVDGTEINLEDLKRILTDHSKWLDTKGKEGKKAVLSRANLQEANLVKANLQKAELWRAYLKKAELGDANLQGAYLREANLQEANLVKANLQEVKMWRANLQKANLQRADLQKANLMSADLQGASLGESDLQGVDLREANLQKANLVRANLQKANLQEANLQGANLQEANLVRANLQEAIIYEADLRDCLLYEVEKLPFTYYEPRAGSTPYIPSIADAPWLQDLTYDKKVHGLVGLREGFKKLGYREQARKVTYAIRHIQTLQLLEQSKPESLKALFELVFFDYTCKWGLAPLLPLKWLSLCIIIGAFLYFFSIRRYSPTSGIWKVWDPERIVKKLGRDKPERITKRGIKSFTWGIYFSLLSSTSLGWRNLIIGKWFIRIQPREYVLKPTGWVRSVSGIQSLIGVYLIFLVIFIYFGQLLGSLRSL